VEAVLAGSPPTVVALEPELDGWFSGLVPGAGPGQIALLVTDRAGSASWDEVSVPR
jgi:hypothetical protein